MYLPWVLDEFNMILGQGLLLLYETIPLQVLLLLLIVKYYVLFCLFVQNEIGKKKGI